MDGNPKDASYLTHIRDVALLPEERVTHVFSPSAGLTGEPPVEGQLLITTDQRIMAFAEEGGKTLTHILPVEELKGVVIRSNARGFGSVAQGLILLGGGLLVYLIVAYWLTGRIDGPTIPVINMDFSALLILLGVVAGLVLLGKYYMAKETGLVVFQAGNWVFTFPYTGSRPKLEIYQLVNSAFVARQSVNGHRRL